MEISLSITKIITGVFTALIIGAVLGSFTLVRTSDSLVYRIIAIELENVEIKKHVVPRSEFDIVVRNQNEKLERIERQLNDIFDKL